jgi:site-specific DNA-methyltransferase (adenine-specific)
LSESHRLIEGDSLRLLLDVGDGTVDAVVTDPPYSSGGLYRGDRANPSVAAKYTQTGTERFKGVTFAGDNRDQRSWAYWCQLWLAEALRATRPGGYLLMFVDWRQLPTATDAVQAGGWTWRGIIAWDKGEAARAPNTAYYRHQCEYVVWGTKGTSDGVGEGTGPWPGCYRFPTRQDDKHHPTGKPTGLMRQLVKCAPIGGLILDPFAGSGTTLVAAALEGRQSLGFEVDPTHARIARRRLAEATAQPPLFQTVGAEPGEPGGSPGLGF